MRELILGGVRSGKSRYAERRAAERTDDVTYIATARTDGDPEMAERIAAHRARRPAHWRTVEAPDDLAGALEASCAPQRAVIVDCLTLWLSNQLSAAGEGDPDRLRRQRQRLLGVLEAAPGDVLLIGNETGLGVMPLNALARQFCDEAGALHQELAALCDEVTWTIAGIAQKIKNNKERDRVLPPSDRSGETSERNPLADRPGSQQQ